ncbi:MAG TPA: hypothetical protein VGG57_22650 [Stellaceae bacterium]|jgi:hypothetical protein
MDEKTQRRSAAVILTLAGGLFAVGIAAEAFPGTEMRRNLYNDRAACERDYSPQQCQPDQSSGGSFTYVHYYSGPEYTANRGAAPSGDPGPGRTGDHASVASSVRGGFGGFAHAAHAGS